MANSIPNSARLELNASIVKPGAQEATTQALMNRFLIWTH
jgi:hypothetical protein